MMNNSSSTSDAVFYREKNICEPRVETLTHAWFRWEEDLFGNIIDDQADTNKGFTRHFVFGQQRCFAEKKDFA